MHAKVGEKVIIREKSENEGKLKWILKQSEEIIETQTGKNFMYTFENEGEFNVVLNLVDGNEIISSNVKVFVGDAYLLPGTPKMNDTQAGLSSVEGKLDAVLETLPPVREDGKIYLEGDA